MLNAKKLLPIFCGHAIIYLSVGIWMQIDAEELQEGCKHHKFHMPQLVNITEDKAL